MRARLRGLVKADNLLGSLRSKLAFLVAKCSGLGDMTDVLMATLSASLAATTYLGLSTITLVGWLWFWLWFGFGSLGESLFCERMQDDSSCLYRYDLSANALPQRPHTCGLVLECVWMCARKLDLSANALLQIVHLNGFSPVERNSSSATDIVLKRYYA